MPSVSDIAASAVEAAVGAAVGTAVGTAVGAAVGTAVGTTVGALDSVPVAGETAADPDPVVLVAAGSGVVEQPAMTSNPAARPTASEIDLPINHLFPNVLLE
ncbi:MAG: hypothetical protein O3B84_05670 [Chloroflexi bacterium]|nr:hypothetical protein [Chloroflexota bacterium]